MKKRVFGRRLSRERDTRRALFRSLIRALVEHGKIETTKAKVKAIQPDIDKIINLAKEKSVFARRRVFAILGNDKKTAKEIFENIAPKFKKRTGGFTRRIPLPRRKGDFAEMVRLEWVETIEISEKSKSKAKTKTKMTNKKSGTGTKKKQ